MHQEVPKRGPYLQIRKVMRERDNLFFTEGMGDLGHRCLPSARTNARLVIAQRLGEIILALAGDAGRRLGAGVVVEMAGRAAAPGGSLGALLRQVRVFVSFRLRRRQRREIGAEIADVLIAELFDDRLHLLVLARTGAEIDQLPLDELVELAGQRRHVLHLRDAVLAVAADAELCLFLAGRDVGGVGGHACEQHGCAGRE